MSTAARNNLTQLRRFVAICDRYEGERRDGRAPCIETFLDEVTGSDRPDLLRMLVALEIDLRRASGDTPTAAEYRERFPDQTEAIDAAFSDLETPRSSVDLGLSTASMPPGWTPPVRFEDIGFGPDAAGDSGAGDARFRVIRAHDRGGLGEVLLARDEDFHRDVAIKVIQARHAHNAQARARFLREAEITARLEHPGIVPVYAVGRQADGRPFYAMRFIRGETLKAAITEYHAETGPDREPGTRALRFRELLRRFLDACNAIAYAHSRGVVHRDLKPANIMLGPFGQTLVVDWGLTKRVGATFGDDGDPTPPGDSSSGPLGPSPGDPDDLTAPDSYLGTFRYMSPEQASGEAARVGPAGDVFGLGATLYHLLTGQAPSYPVEGDAALRAAIRAGSVTPPRQLRPETDPSLEAICLKAMARLPVDRYPSATALADDLARWLADEPTSAYPDPPTVRASRWLRRHRTSAASAAALLLTAVVALAIGAAAVGGRNRLLATANDEIGRRNRQLAQANARIGAERDRVDEARLAAEAAREDTELARDQALKYSKQNINILEAVLGQVVGSDLPNVPGAERLRLRLAAEGAKYLEAIREEKPSDPEVRLLAGRSYRELANILRLLGSPQAGNAYKSATDLLRSLVDQFPEEHRYRRTLAATLEDAGEWLRMRGRITTSERYLREALASADRLFAVDPEDASNRRMKARTSYNLANQRFLVGEYAEARRLGQAAAALLTPLADADRPGPTDRLQLALLLGNLGGVLREEGRLVEAETILEGALRRSSALIQAVPGDPNARYVHALNSLELGRNLAVQADRRADAERCLDEAVGRLDILAEQAPTVPHYRQRRAEALATRAAWHAAQDRPGPASDDAGRARDLLEALRREAPDHPLYDGLLGIVLGRLADLSLEHDAPDDPRDLLERAIVLQGRALKANPSSPPDLRALEHHREALGRFLAPTPGPPEGPDAGRAPASPPAQTKVSSGSS